MRWPFPPLPRAVPLGFLGTLALVWGVEAYLARHDLRFSTMVADVWASARRAAERPPTGGILVFGDSQVELGISPLTVESRLGQPVQCLAVPGGQATSSYFLLRTALAAGAIPSAVVVDFEPNLLRKGREPNARMWNDLASLDESLDLARTMGSPEAFLRMACGKALVSLRQRHDIRENITAALLGREPAGSALIASVRRNRGMNRGALLMPKQTTGFQYEIKTWADEAQRPWTPDPTNEAYAHRFLELAAKHRLRVFCAVMPVVPSLHEVAAATGFDEAYYQWLRRLQRRHPNLYVLDWRNAGYPASVFFDCLHLDVEGAASVGSALADYLRGCFGEAGTAQRWVVMPGLRSEGSFHALEDQTRSDGLVRAALAEARTRR